MIQIFDANAYLRQDLSRTDGVAPLSPRLIYGQTTSLQIWVWDGPNNNDRRRAVFPGYKIRDYSGQENIFEGLKIYRDLLSVSAAAQVTVPTYEADDVCYSLAKRFTAAGTPVTIYTNDFDFFQLMVNPLVTLKGVRAPAENIDPRFVSLYKAMCGDSSDKIPGIPGFGKKTFDKFRELHAVLDKAMRDRDAEALRAQPFTPKIAAWLSDEDNVRQIFDFYQITQMIEVPEALIEKHWQAGKPDPYAASKIFERFML